MLFMRLIIFCGIMATTVDADISKCPSNLSRNRYLRQLENSCYEFVFNHHGNWDIANNDCKRRGGHLVTIGSSTEQAFIFNSLNVLNFQNDRGVWIGLTDHDSEGTWKWVTGERVSYKYWASGQPGLFGTFEDCALLEFKNGGHWHDYSCTGVLFNKQSHAWVCEYAVVINPSTTMMSPLSTANLTTNSSIISTTSKAMSTRSTTTSTTTLSDKTTTVTTTTDQMTTTVTEADTTTTTTNGPDTTTTAEDTTLEPASGVSGN